jgi:RNA polymerase sigma-70 factor (ECF subfamily)
MTAIALPDEQAGAILARAAAGDELAFTRLVAAHHSDMRRVAYVVCHDAETAEDACQQAWQIAARRLSSVREPAKVRSWLVAVAANEARKLAKRQQRRNILEASVRPITDGGRDPSDSIDQADLSRALSRLSPDDRLLVALRYAADLDSSQIAAIRGGSASGTRARLARILDRLRKELQDA